MLLTKLHIPSTGNNIVQRSALYEKLNLGLSRKLILVSAPAGFGKTTLLSDWISLQKIPTAWFSLDKADNDPVEFLNYIVSGIQSIHKDFGESALKLLNSPNKPSSESIINLLINEMLEIDQNFLLVLDDFHLIESAEVITVVSYLLEHIPTNIHIVILTRSDPTLSISRLRSQQQLIELRSSDLSFSANDISILFNKKLKLGLSIDDVYSLETKTEGWIAGLQLTALSMQGRDDISEFIQDLKGDNRYIMDYLMEEVLKVQSDEVKEFLLQTSILNQMSAPLCNAILDRSDSQLMLETLEQNNMFVIPLDNDRNWYRYHHLFADLLKQRLQLQDKEVVTELHNKACKWFEQNNMFDFAIEHALAIKNHEKCIQLIGEVVEKMWENGHHAAILKYGDLLPDELIKTNPEFCLYYSWILISAGQIQKAKPFLESAELKTNTILQEINTSKELTQYHKKLLGKISVAYAYLHSHGEQSDKTFDYCKSAMENLSEVDPLWFSWAWFSYGIAYFSIGELQEGSTSFDKAIEYAKKAENIYLISAIVIRMAENEQQLGHYKAAYEKCNDLLLYLKKRGYAEIAETEWTFAALYLIIGITESMWANMDKALENIQIAYNLTRDVKDIYLRIMILMIYSSLLRMFGNKDADIRMTELDEILKHNEVPPFIASMYISWKMYYLLEHNEIESGFRLFTDFGIEIENNTDHIYEMFIVSYARLLFASGRLAEAEKMASELYPIVSEGQRVERMIELKMILAVINKTKGNRIKAINNLMDAFEMASEENLISFFVYSFVDVDDLYEEIFKIQASTKNNISCEFISNLKKAIKKRNSQIKISLESGLSDRELDTLKLMAQELPNQQIADKLFISLNTVKTHVRNILLKLEVENRSQAVNKAKEQGII